MKHKIVRSHLKRSLRAEWWQVLTDPRGRQGRRYKLSELMQLLVVAMCARALTLRDVEQLGRDVRFRRSLGLRGTPSDTTLERIIRLVAPEMIKEVLRLQVRQFWRSKQLPILDEVGISLVAVDGKAIGTDAVRKHPEAQSQGTDEVPRFVLRTLRAVHVASAVKPVLDQLVLPAKGGEADNFIPFVQALQGAYGRLGLLECISVDAGFTSRGNMHWLEEEDIGFIAALKGDQPTLHAEALRLLGQGDEEPPGGWEVTTRQVAGSRRVTRYFSRSTELAGCHGWTCIRQVWRVGQRREEGSKVTWEDRYFLVNLAWDRLSPRQALRAVQAHWGIENDSNWTMDTQWMEDSRAWVRQGTALETLALLRCLAYNVARLLRHRTFRGKSTRGMRWRLLFQRVRDALVLPRQTTVADRN